MRHFYKHNIVNFTSTTTITNYINQKARRKMKIMNDSAFFSHNMAKNDFYIFLRKERTRKLLFFLQFTPRKNEFYFV